MFIPLTTLARPYAQAIFDFSYKNKTLDKWELMLVCAKKIIEDQKIKFLSNVNLIKSTELSDLIILIGKHNFDVFGQNFIRIVVEYGRLGLIPVILDRFLVLKRKWEMTLQIKIVTANFLDDIQMLEIKSFFEKKFLCTINIIYELDSSIIGGMLIYVNNSVIDGSIRGRLERLKNILGVEGKRRYAIKFG